MGKSISRRCWAAAAACAVIGVAAMAVYLQWRRATTHSWVMLACVAALIAVGAVLFAQQEKRITYYGLGFGALFVLLQLCGERLSGVGTIARTDSELIWLAVCTAGLTPAAGGAFALFVQAAVKAQRCTHTGRKHSRFVFWGSAAALLVCWLPYLLAFYPGLFTYDISWQYQQYQTWELNTHHPLLHTLLVGGFCELGWHLFGYPVKGLLMYTLFQMALMALAMASAISLLYRHHAPAWVCWLMLIADAVLPFNTLLAVSSTKDTLFSGAVLYLCVLLVEMLLEKDTLRRPGWMIRFVLAQAAVGLMRNNGFICIAVLVLVSAVGLIRHRRTAKRLLALSLCGLMLYSGTNTGLKAATGAQDGHFREMLSVPLQQLGRVHHLTDDEAKPEIEKWLPTVELYSPHLADFVKNMFDAEKEELPELFRLWAEVGRRHPIIYVDSMLATSAGFYHIDAMPTGLYLETSFHEDEGWWLKEDSKWPGLRDLLARLYSNNEFLDIPILNALLSPALWVWMLVLAFFAALCTRHHAAALAGLVCAALYLTALLGPCVMVRYVYPFMLAAPLLLGTVMTKYESKQAPQF